MSDERIYLLSRTVGNYNVKVQVLVQGDYIPAKGPAYDHGGLPAEYPIAEVLSITLANDPDDILLGVDAKTIAGWEQDALDLDYETEYDEGEGDPDPDAEY